MKAVGSILLIVMVLLVSITVLAPARAQGPSRKLAQAATSPSVSPTSSGKYWFQVGASMPQGIVATGARVEIQVKTPQNLPDPDAALAYWVGIDLPNDAFIQVGYEISSGNNQGIPSWYWEYFLPGTAKEATGGFLGEEGNVIGSNGTWYQFSLASAGNVWSAFVNGQQVGSIDLGISNSGGSSLYAVAEVAGTMRSDNILGPVKFRNLQYRDAFNRWHDATIGLSVCCFSAGSDTYSGAYAYGVQSIPGQNNTWLAGSNLFSSIQEEGINLWPWYYVTVTSPYRNSSGWYVLGDSVDLSMMADMVPISATSRFLLEGWYVNVNGWAQPDSALAVTGAMALRANYVKQYLVQVTSPTGTTSGSGWYNDGANATISVTPSKILAAGVLGQFGVGTMPSWEGDFSGPLIDGQSVLTVHSSLRINAVWRTDYGVLPYIAVLVAAAVCLGLVQLRRNASEATEP